VPEILNLQPRGSQAEVYQVKQLRGVIVAHGLAGAPESDLPDEEPQAEVSDRSTLEGEADGG
jgi:hypothetical protein